MKPYIEEILNENLSIRQFDNSIDEQELVWHRDREDRIIIPLQENDWKIQLDNQLPINLNPNNPIFIESGQYHRVIKGNDDLFIKVFKINLDDSENLNETIKKTLNLFLENKVPKKYLKGLKDSGEFGSKSAMKKEIEKFKGKDEYKKDWKADFKDEEQKERIKTKESEATKAYNKLFKEEEDLNEISDNIITALKNKSEKSEIPLSILKKVYKKGKAAWNTGHRPGTSQDQWAMGRVNSFITGIGGARKADNDLWKKAKVLMKESLTEEYPQSFDMEYFKTLTSFAQRINYCTEHLQRLASGSSRVVFKIDDEKVLKLAKNKKGLAQNEVEIDYSHYDGLEGILAKVFDYEENNLWLEMELAVRAKKSDFKKIVGFSFEDYSSALFNHEIDASNSKTRYGKMNLDKDVLDAMWENEFMQDMFDLIGTYGIPSGDLRRVNSYGIVKRNGEDTIVLVDYGLTSDVYQDYYSTN